MVCAGCISFYSFAQSWIYQTLRVTTNKTTTLIFPAAIKRGDVGTGDVLAQKVAENENILFLKAAKPNFNETNLNVVTDDGKLYTFAVAFDSMPGRMVYNISPGEAANRNEVMFEGNAMNPATVKSLATKIVSLKRVTNGVNDESGDVKAYVSGIYIKENILFFQIALENNSSIGYDLDFIRFSILDNNVSKRTASQRQELKPVCVAGGRKQVKAGKRTVAVFAFEKFTIPDKKSFIIQIGEKNGGRQLQLRVKNRKLIKAEPIGAQ